VAGWPAGILRQAATVTRRISDGIIGGNESEGNKVEILFILVAMAVLGALAILWGVDSTPSVDDPEWEHRHEWAVEGRQ